MLRVILPLFAVVFMLTATQVEDEAPPDTLPEPVESDAPGSAADALVRALEWSHAVNAGVFAVARDIVGEGPVEAWSPTAPNGAAQSAIPIEIGAGLARLGAGWARVMDWVRGDAAAVVGPGDAVADRGVVPLSDR